MLNLPDVKAMQRVATVLCVAITFLLGGIKIIFYLSSPLIDFLTHLFFLLAFQVLLFFSLIF